MVRMTSRNAEIAGGPAIRGLLAFVLFAVAQLDALQLVNWPPSIDIGGKFDIFQGRNPATHDWVLIGGCLALALLMSILRIPPDFADRTASLVEAVPVKVWWWFGRIGTGVAMAAYGWIQLREFFDD